MIGKGSTAEKPITLAEVLEILERRKREGELDYGQRLTYDYAQKFARLNAKNARKLVEELLELGNLREHQAVALANLMPESPEDVQLIFQKERIRLTDEDVQKILELINRYRK